MKLSRVMLSIWLVIGFAAHADEKNAWCNPLSSTSKAMRVMSYNIRRKGSEKRLQRMWHQRLPLVVEVINQVQPDIIAMQEATAEQIADLRQVLVKFEVFGEGRGVSWWGLGTNEYTPIFFNAERFEVLDQGTFSINQSSGTVGWMPWQVKNTGWLPRICTWGKLKDKRTNTEFYMYNTHLDHQYEQARLKGIAVIKEVMAHKEEDKPLVLVGDFNAEFAGALKASLSMFTHAKDMAQIVAGPFETRTGWEDSELKWIDHIIVRNAPNVHVNCYTVVQMAERIYPSDHRPVFADILFEQEKERKKKNRP